MHLRLSAILGALILTGMPAAHRQISIIPQPVAVTGMEGDVVTMQDIFVFERHGLTPEGRVTGRFAATGIRPKFNEKLLMAGIRLDPALFDEIVEV